MGLLTKFRRRFDAKRACAALAAAVTMLAASFPSGAASPVEREYEQAVRSFRAGRMSDAFGRFVELANRGDVDSARIALFMQSYGQVLYGKQWDAGPDDVAYWSMLVRNSGQSTRQLPEIQQTVLTPNGGKARHAPARTRVTPQVATVSD